MTVFRKNNAKRIIEGVINGFRGDCENTVSIIASFKTYLCAKSAASTLPVLPFHLKFIIAQTSTIDSDKLAALLPYWQKRTDRLLTRRFVFYRNHLNINNLLKCAGMWHRLCDLMEWMTNEIENKCLLVVDDDERMLRALDKVLTNEGARVVCSCWAGGAIGILTDRKIRVDLVIIDLCMPIISGQRAVYVIHRFYPKLPIVVLTAFGSPTVKNECLRDGAVAFLEKPLDAAALIDAVRGAMSPQAQAKNRGDKKCNERKE